MADSNSHSIKSSTQRYPQVFDWVDHTPPKLNVIANAYTSVIPRTLR